MRSILAIVSALVTDPTNSQPPGAARPEVAGPDSVARQSSAPAQRQVPTDSPRKRPSTEAIDELRVELKSVLNDPIGRLQQSANTAVSSARNAGVTFLLFGFYLAVIFGGTTHYQLLREDRVALPILDIGLPLIGFYWIAPLIFVLLHLNFLISLYFLAQKLRRLDIEIDALDSADQKNQARALLHPFPVVQMLIGRDQPRLARALLNVLIWAVVAVLPVLLLLLGQTRFLPYHDHATTGFHSLLVLADVAILWLLWLPILSSNLDPRASRKREPDRRFSFRGLIRRVKLWSVEAYWIARSQQASRRLHTFEASFFSALTIFAIIMTFQLIVIPESYFAKTLDDWIGPENSLPLIARNLAPDNKDFTSAKPSPDLIERMGGDEAAAFEKYGLGIDLRGRDLRYADLSNGDLRKARFDENANLRGADLGQANLKGANLGGSSLQGTWLRAAQLQAAFLVEADLQGAHLIDANLQGANLGRALLNGAILYGANLQGANLTRAQLIGANLSSTDLKGAHLRNSDLRGADLKSAELQGAALSAAYLEGVDLSEADFRGADLQQAELWRALIDHEDDAKDRWQFADSRGVRFSAFKNVKACIEEVVADLPEGLGTKFWPGDPDASSAMFVISGINRGGIRKRVLERLNESLIDPGRNPKPILPIASDLPPDQEALASFLGGLACGKDGNHDIARGIQMRLRNSSNIGPIAASKIVEQLLNDCPAVEWSNQEVTDLNRLQDELAESLSKQSSKPSTKTARRTKWVTSRCINR